MRTLNRYIVFDYLVIFFTALLLITFVMTVGAMLKAVDLMARGISMGLITKFFFQNIPYILSYSMPISTLFSALLLFGRLSMDNEISAMKACGLSLWRVAAPLILLSVLFTGICIYINSEIAPEAKYANKKLLRSAGVDEPINLLDEGRFIDDFKGLLIFVGQKKENKFKDVVIYKLNNKGGIQQSIRARRGEVEADNDKKILTIKLYDGHREMFDEEDPMDLSKAQFIPFEYVRFPLDFKNMLEDDNEVRRKESNMTLGQLICHIRNIDRDFPLVPEDKRAISESRFIIEASRRISTAVACFSFMLIGIPLGVKSHRKETSVGMVVSLAIVFAYYTFIVIAKSLVRYPFLHPDLVLWVPLIGTQILGLILIRRSS